MADTSSYSIEERLVASVWVHGRQHTGQTMSQVTAAFWERFKKAAPRRAILLDWEKNERSLFEVLKTGRGVGEKQRAWKHAAVAASIERSTKRLPLPLNVPRSVCRFH